MNDTTTVFCPLERVVDMIDGKWKALILWHLRKGALRFSEIRRHNTGISQKMLTQQLRDLENHGLISRTVFAEVPPHVEYALTDTGNSLMPLLIMINNWGHDYYRQ